MVGETISHYKILERLGAGGMGEVYKAEDTKLHRHVALKLMLDQDGKNDEHRKQMRQRFLREAQAASALNHPNIATVYEIDEFIREGKRFSFIAMEYVPGHTLKQAAQNLSLAESLEVISQIADALAEAHDRGIVHRDIKPSKRLVIGADEPFTRYYVACASAMMGNKQAALEHLTKAIEGRRNFNAARARVEIDFESLRDDPKFQTMIAETPAI